MAVRYRDEVLEPIVRLYAAAVGPISVLMDDNAHPHRADIVKDYLESERIAHMAWPAYSPDLNPIENLWDALGCAVSSRFPPLATLIELETALQEEWRLLNSAEVDHLIESMGYHGEKPIKFNYNIRYSYGNHIARQKYQGNPSCNVIITHLGMRTEITTFM
ncbi:transposable element Tcb1 transposase [Trichonephila clavipes]|nr:transposable element Tcb1 transposase [Trichonephila clavipes]